jgi:hypothetical protein
MFLHLALAVVVAAVFVFISSSLVHMVFKWHNSDYKQLADEDTVRAAVRASASGPGQYMIPYCMGMKEAQSPEMQAKWTQGPVAYLHVRANGLPKMGPMLGQWFLLNLVVAKLTALLALCSLGAAADAHRIFHLTALATFLAYGAGSVSNGIWKGQSWKSVAKDLLDALIYAIVSGLAFAWLWPG